MPDSDAPTLAALPTTRRALLLAIKRAGEIGADELAAELAITVSAVRQQLGGLAADGLIERRDERKGPGRPRHLYRLSELGDTLFPRTYGELTTELLDYADQEDPELVERLFARRRDRRIELATARMEGKPFPEQVRVLTEILDEDGYLAELVAQPDGSFRIVEHNCAILAVAMKYGTACGSELAFIRQVLPGADVERVSHLLAGAHTCAYEVRPRS